jgi:hypothetical protein
MGNTLKIMLGSSNDDFQEDFEESPNDESEEADDKSQPPENDFQPGDAYYDRPDFDLDEIDGVEEAMTLGMDDSDANDNASDDQGEPTRKTESISEDQEGKRKPKLASGGTNEEGGSKSKPKLAGGNDSFERLPPFDARETRPRGTGRIMGGGGGSPGGGAIAG